MKEMSVYTFITGATGGLGRAFCREAAGREMNLFLTDIPGSPLEELSRELRQDYAVDVRFLEGDFLTAASRDRFFEALEKESFATDFLINVAGMEFESAFRDQSLEQIRLIMNVNMNGTVELTSRLLERRAAGRIFRILTVSSLSYAYPMPFKALYSSSKRFLYQFFTALRAELGKDQVTVTLLCPAGMPTKEAVIRRIEAQGIMGKITTLSPAYVAKRSICKALAGKKLYIPGPVNRLLRLAGGFMDDSVLAEALKRRWESTS